jgi:hypothetical protein
VETLGPAAARVILEYPGFRAVLDANIQPDRLELAARVEKAQETPEVYLQLPFLMKGPEEIVTGTGGRYSTEDQQEISPQAMGSTIGREGKFTLRGVEGGRALLYLLPYNTHWRTGWSPPEKAVGVVAVPVGAGRTISVVASGG